MTSDLDLESKPSDLDLESKPSDLALGVQTFRFGSSDLEILKEKNVHPN
jgi:hypothetical protein